MRKTPQLALFCLFAALQALADVTSAPAVHVDIEKVNNVGDVAPVDGLRSAGQPDAEAIKLFADAGYVAVIDLRGEKEKRGFDERAVVEQYGLEYVSMPVAGAGAINYAGARYLDSLLSRFDGPVLVHCASGNRVGALLALRASLAGADDAEALTYGKSAGLTRLESAVKKRLAENSEK